MNNSITGNIVQYKGYLDIDNWLQKSENSDKVYTWTTILCMYYCRSYYFQSSLAIFFLYPLMSQWVYKHTQVTFSNDQTHIIYFVCTLYFRCSRKPQHNIIHHLWSVPQPHVPGVWLLPVPLLCVLQYSAIFITNNTHHTIVHNSCDIVVTD